MRQSIQFVVENTSVSSIEDLLQNWTLTEDAASGIEDGKRTRKAEMFKFAVKGTGKTAVSFYMEPGDNILSLCNLVSRYAEDGYARISGNEDGTEE
jgi:hypothetical protein